MLDLIGSGLVSFWLGVAGVQAKPLEAIEVLALQSSPALVLAAAPHPARARRQPCGWLPQPQVPYLILARKPR